MEKEKAIGLPPDVIDSLTLHKNLPEQNDIKSCQYKLKVCEELMVLKGFDDTDVEEYLAKMDHQDEFFNTMIDAENEFNEDLQRDEYYRLWFWFLKQSIEELKYTIEYFKVQELKKATDLKLLELKKTIENHPGLGNENLVELVENHSAIVNANCLEISELVRTEYNGVVSYDQSSNDQISL